MGNTVSREHAKLPFGYTHAKKDHSVSTSSVSRKRFSTRILRTSDITSITPFPIQDGSSSVASIPDLVSLPPMPLSLLQQQQQEPSSITYSHHQQQQHYHHHHSNNQDNNTSTLSISDSGTESLVPESDLIETTIARATRGGGSGGALSRSTTITIQSCSHPNSASHSNNPNATSCCQPSGSSGLSSACVMTNPDMANAATLNKYNNTVNNNNNNIIVSPPSSSSSSFSNRYDQESSQRQTQKVSSIQEEQDNDMDIISALGIANIPYQGSYDFFSTTSNSPSSQQQHQNMLTKQDTLIICSSNKSNQQGGAGVGVGEYETQVSSTAVGSDFRGHASYKSAPSYELKGNQVHKQQDDDYLDSWDENTLRLERCEAESIMDEEMGQLSPIPFSELPNLTNIGLCSYGIVKLSSNIRLLASATCVQICCNELSSIPAEIGYLRNLTLLDLSKNNLTSLPETITNLTKLVDLKLSYNQLEYIPAGIGGLTKLAALSLDNNKLESIPHQIGLIKGLVNLDLSDNPITVLPAEIGKLQFLRRLKLDRCPLVEEFSHSPLHSPPTLLELAARVIVRHDIPVPPMMVPHLKEYISSAGTCSFCDGPYFDSWVKRGKMIEKNEATIPLEYTLCQPHWNTEQERIKLLFCKRPITSPPLKKPASATTSQQGKGDSTLGGGNTAQSSSDASSTNSPNRPLNRKYLSESGVRQRPPPSSIAGRFSFLRNRSNSSSSSSNSNSNNGNGGSSSGQRPTSTYRTYSMPTIASTSTTSTSTPTRARALTSAPSPLSGSVFSSSSSSPITASASVSATNSGDHHISLYEMDSNHTYNSNSNNENNGSRLNSRRSVTASILARASFKLKRPLSMGAALLEPAVTSMGIAGPAPAE